MRRLAIASLLVNVVLGLSLASAEPQESAGLQPEISKRLETLLPDAKQLGAECPEAPAFYSPATLYTYMNGGAEAFLVYDFVGLAHALYQKGDAEITVDVFDMGNSENAFGVYTSERSPESDFIALGAEGYESEFLVNFFQDRYCVKLSGFSDTQKAQQFLRPFAEAISSRIGTGAHFPETLQLFPRAGLLPHTETFVRRSPLGREFLAPAYSARYRNGQKETLLMLSLAPSPQQARERIEQLRRHVQAGGAASAATSLPGGFSGETSYEGKILAFPHDRFAVIIVDPPDPSGDFVSLVVSALEKAAKQAP